MVKYGENQLNRVPGLRGGERQKWVLKHFQVPPNSPYLTVSSVDAQCEEYGACILRFLWSPHAPLSPAYRPRSRPRAGQAGAATHASWRS